MSLGNFPTARRGFDASDSEFALAQSARRIPDAAIARMMGRSVLDVRAITRRALPSAVESTPAVEPEPDPEPIIYTLPDPKTPPPEGTMAACFWWTAKRHGLTTADLKGRTKKLKIAHARQEAMWECAEVLREDGARKFTSTEIGRFCGGRDHATALWGIRKHGERLAARMAAQ